MVQAETWHTTS